MHFVRRHELGVGRGHESQSSDAMHSARRHELGVDADTWPDRTRRMHSARRHELGVSLVQPPRWARHDAFRAET